MPERTDRAMEVLADLLEAPEAERPALLERTCAGDEALRDEVAGLLRLGRRASDFLLRVDPAREEPFQSLPHGGTSFGKYRTLRLVGEGGMGSVYEAEQDHPRRRVALKVIKPGMDSRQVIRRFEAERQALALMDHPNIAKVFDAGLDDRGRPFFAMELVEGVPLTEYCDAGALDMRQRLELFAAVCRAVQHAHQRAVIHRDLKPTNVLVAVVDGRPVPKVIDFGIAKAVGDGRLTEQTLVTECRELVGTPEYMSPEQAAGGGDVDTRSDIYSLGVLLYELLTGTTPFDRGQARDSGPEELRRLIREAEPPKPSTRLTQRQRQSGAGASGGGGGEKAPPAAARAVRGELDWITMKCLEKDRARRYETASELAADVGRYLSYEPVHAAAPSPWYRFRKFARRNRAPLAAAAAIAVLLVAGITGSTVGMLRAREAQAQARRDADQFVALTEFLSDMFRGARPVPAGGRRVTVDEIVDRAAASISTKFRNQPEAEIRVRRAWGETYQLLGNRSAAIEQMEVAYDLARRTYGEDGAPTLEIACFLGYAIKLDAPTQAEAERADALYRRTHELALRRWGEFHRATHTAAYFVGSSLVKKETKESCALAEPIFRRMIEVQRGRPELAAPLGSTAAPYSGLADALWVQGKLDEAEWNIHEALRLDLADGFRGTRSHAMLLRKLGGILRDQGKLTEAAEAFGEGVALEKELGHRLVTIDRTADDYLDVLVRLNQYDKAIEYAESRVKLAEGDAPADPALVARRTSRLRELREQAARHNNDR